MKLINLSLGLMLSCFLFCVTGCSDDATDPACTVGGACDDGNSLTAGDVYDADCHCAGASIFSTFTDTRDATVYVTVAIGSQEWFAENLNYDTGSSWCYDDMAANCAVYGRIYDWETAKVGCPVGWHLPSLVELQALATQLGGISVAGGKMKEAGLSHWNTPNTGATNQSGFSGLPAGFRNISPTFRELGNQVYFWSGDSESADLAWTIALNHNSNTVDVDYYLKGEFYSVRCLKN